MQVLMWIAIIGIGAILLTGVIWLLHRFAIRLEEAGYIYYREQPRGGGLGVWRTRQACPSIDPAHD